VNTGVLALVVAVSGLHYLVANLIAIGAAMTWNFAANARWTWLRTQDSPAHTR
jgi:putative flippase GtrA